MTAQKSTHPLLSADRISGRRTSCMSAEMARRPLKCLSAVAHPFTAIKRGAPACAPECCTRRSVRDRWSGTRLSWSGLTRLASSYAHIPSHSSGGMITQPNLRSLPQRHRARWRASLRQLPITRWRSECYKQKTDMTIPIDAFAPPSRLASLTGSDSRVGEPLSAQASPCFRLTPYFGLAVRL